MQPRIATLLQAFQALAPQYLGKRFVLTSGDRDCVRQLELSGPTSFHVVGQAFDGVLQPYDARLQALLGAVAENLGFRWGGNFASPDVVHFDDGRRNSPGRCSTVGGANLLGAVAAMLAQALYAGGSTLRTKGIEALLRQGGGISNSSNQAGGAAVETICGPEQRPDGSFTGRVTCEPYIFGPSGQSVI